MDAQKIWNYIEMNFLSDKNRKEVEWWFNDFKDCVESGDFN